MGWKLRGSPKTHKITAKLAKEWAEMESAIQDRPLSERRLQVHRNTLNKDGFRPVLWAVAYCKELENDHFRINGKHTSTLFASVDLSKHQDLYATIEEYECDTIEDMAALYATFDTQIQSRNTTDINRSFASAIPELKEFDNKTINLIVSAIEYSKNPHKSSGGSSRTAMDRAEELFDNIGFAQWVNKLLNDVDYKASIHLRRVPVMAAAYGTYQKSMKAATEFWTAVRDMTGDKPNLPDRKLALFLVQMKIATSTTKGIPDRFRLTPREFYYKSLTAWNAWRKGTTTELKYYANAKLPAIS